MRVRSLASASHANCLVLDVGDSVYLLDAGLPSPNLVRRLAASGVSPEHVAGVILTHEHLDHARSALFLSETFQVPIYTLRGTAMRLELPGSRVRILSPHRNNALDALSVVPVTVSHDAAEPCGFLVSHRGITLGYFVDLGKCDERLLECASQADLLIIEANHDEEMLWTGPYPYNLKRRIAGPTGHLSNRQTADALEGLPRLPRRIVLAHLSAHNNRPELALREVATRLSGTGCSVAVLPRSSPGPWIGPV